jgi:hypothetical protein
MQIMSVTSSNWCNNWNESKLRTGSTIMISIWIYIKFYLRNHYCSSMRFHRLRLLIYYFCSRCVLNSKIKCSPIKNSFFLNPTTI